MLLVLMEYTLRVVHKFVYYPLLNDYGQIAGYGWDGSRVWVVSGKLGFGAHKIVTIV